MSELPPLSLYIHFPWCVAKCPYCDFNSHSLRGELPAEAYIDALIADLSVTAEAFVARDITTVFFGGGTPSLFKPAQFERLLTAVRDRLSLSADAEITLEANPGAVEHAAFAGYRVAGINRLSLGVQSLQDDKLQSLGRIHSVDDVYTAWSEARSAGFDNINLDLMYALPEQTLEEAVADVDAVLDLQPEHISHYHLTLEPNTVFYSRPPPLPDSDLAWEIQLACAEKLQMAGYENYEVSAWAKQGRQAQHNLNYWRYGDYLGLGAGAHAKLSDADGSRWREVRPAHPRAYLEWAIECPVDRQAITAEDARFEFMLNNLRLREGFSLSDFERLTGQPAEELRPRLEHALGLGLLENTDEIIRPTPTGWRFLDDLQGIFLPGQ
jgi:oxygen-independent coproporphyrinogen-3 oxidase